MSATTRTPSVPPESFSRLVGRVRGEAPGPTLIALGGIHGNEPAGVYAARRVVARLQDRKAALRGDLVCLAGNVAALRRRQRYLVKDLNRQWTAERMSVAAASAAVDQGDIEAREQIELRDHLDDAIAAARGPVTFLDLHTTSAEGIPFALVADGPIHRAFAAHFPLPLILGMVESVEGVLCRHMAARDCVTLVVEAGQHESPISIERHEAVLWLALEAAGLLRGTDLPERDPAFALLDRARHGLPHVIEVLARHAVREGQDFRMEPGFANIGRVRAGQSLAHDRDGEIRAPADGMLLLPLYQQQGEDGFFLGRETGF